MKYNLADPSQHVKGLVYAPSYLEEPRELAKDRAADKRLDVATFVGRKELYTPLCWACGWTPYTQLNTEYAPRIKIFHARRNMGLWSLGSRWLLRDQPNDGSMGNDEMTQQFLRAQPGLTVPLVAEMQNISHPTDDIQFTLIARAQGVTLGSIWHTLSLEQKASYGRQLGDVLKQIRQLTAPGAQKVDGTPLDDEVVAFCGSPYPPTCKKMGRTMEEWLDNISDELYVGLSVELKTQDPAILLPALEEIKAACPKGGPYVLTHGDLDLTNIMVKDDKIEAIIDWEMSGYMPWWAEAFVAVVYDKPDNLELFRYAWNDIHPDMDEQTFEQTWALPIWRLHWLWDLCEKTHSDGDLIHWDHTPGWFKPPFCECKPYGGRIRQWHIHHPDHRIADAKEKEMRQMRQDHTNELNSRNARWTDEQVAAFQRQHGYIPAPAPGGQPDGNPTL